MKHLLFINQHYAPDFAATGQLLAELCDDLVTFGYQVTVITGFPEQGTFPEGEKPQKVEKKGSLTIYRLYNHPAGNKSILNRLIHFFSFWLLSIIKSFRVSKPDLVFIMSTPPLLNGMTANLIRIFRGVPYLYNVQDLYPEIAVAMGTIKNKQVIRLSESLENYINSKALVISTLSDLMKLKIQSHGVERDKIHVIPNWSDGNKIVPLDHSKLRNSWGLDNNWVLMYSGNVGMSQGLVQLTEWLAEIAEWNDNFRFVIVGNGVKLPELKHMVSERNYQFVSFFPFQPKENLSESLGVANLHLVPLMEGMSQYLLPSKTYGIMAAGKPMLAVVDPDSEVDRLIRQVECGFSVKPGDRRAFVAAIKTAIDQPEMTKQQGLSGRQYFEKHLTRKVATSEYIKLISQLVSS